MYKKPYWIFVFALIFGFIGGILGSKDLGLLNTANARSRFIETQGIRIVDYSGRVRGELGLDSNENVYLEFYDRDSESRLMFHFERNRPRLIFVTPRSSDSPISFSDYRGVDDNYSYAKLP